MPKTKILKKTSTRPISREEEMDEVEDIKPKIKAAVLEVEEDEKTIDPEGILGDEAAVETEAATEDDELLDEDEVDPFKDKWEE